MEQGDRGGADSTFLRGIMPQPTAEWMRGKCALKALQYMACGVPCVATPFGCVTEFMRSYENGILANATKEWLEALIQLRDPVLRHSIGSAGRDTVLFRYNLRDAQVNLLSLLKSLL